MSEESLARRVTYERERRDWSPAQLAKAMTDAGYPMNQSSVWKMEHGEPRRKISVDEAIGFAEVFGLNLGDMLVSPELAAEKELLELLSQYEAHFTASTRERHVCNQLAGRLETLLAMQPEARAALVEAVTKAFSDRPDFDTAISFLQRNEQTLMPEPARWWNFFIMMHGAYGELSVGVPNLLSAEDDKRLAAAELDAERRANRNGEHQETT